MIFTKQSNALLIREKDELIKIEAWGKHALRVRATKKRAFEDCQKGLLPTDPTASVQIELDLAGFNLDNGYAAEHANLRACKPNAVCFTHCFEHIVEKCKRSLRDLRHGAAFFTQIRFIIL